MEILELSCGEGEKMKFYSIYSIYHVYIERDRSNAKNYRLFAVISFSLNVISSNCFLYYESQMAPNHIFEIFIVNLIKKGCALTQLRWFNRCSRWHLHCRSTNKQLEARRRCHKKMETQPQTPNFTLINIFLNQKILKLILTDHFVIKKYYIKSFLFLRIFSLLFYFRLSITALYADSLETTSTIFLS